MQLSNLKKKKLNTLRNMARDLGLKNYNDDDHKTLAFRLYLAHKTKKTLKKTNYVTLPTNQDLLKQRIKSYTNNLNFVNMYSLETLNLNTTNFSRYLIVKQGNKLNFIKKKDLITFLRSSSTHKFYKISERQSNGKYINKRTIYYRIPIPQNYMITHKDYTKLLINMKKAELLMIELIQTDKLLNEVISLDVANHEGSIVGSHHGPDYVYNIKFLP